MVPLKLTFDTWCLPRQALKANSKYNEVLETISQSWTFWLTN